MAETETELTETQQKYCNAYVTACYCGGHTKAQRNVALVEFWRTELKEWGIAVPTDTQAAKFGSFNGEGSS